jgi:inosine-uridine nucleoside N-ribohydrolase
MTEQTRKPIPVILDTDIGGDIDDTWALAHLLRSPELDLKLVLTSTGEARYRAAITAKVLEVAGRTDVAVGLGKDYGPMEDRHRNQAPWIRGYELERYPGIVHEDGIGAAIDLIMGSDDPVTIIAIGAVPNWPIALRRQPGIAGRAKFVGMHGSFRVGYGRGSAPTPEANVRSDPEALRQTLAAPWQEVLLTPLDTCGLIVLRDEKYRSIWCATHDPLMRAVIENYCIWAPRVPWMHCNFFTTRSNILFDCVAVYLAYSEDLVEVERLSFRIDDKGMTIEDPAGPLSARVAMRWKDQDAFEDHLTRRLLGQE